MGMCPCQDIFSWPMNGYSFIFIVEKLLQYIFHCIQRKREWERKMALVEVEWEKGLQSTAAPFHAQIQQLADMHELKFEQVKVKLSFHKEISHI